jgi:alkanesulfonate monooxygenase SsuD/methylene tetrahydromethanopterin reductase-like flavin-dependent oxidoreductase (luciferase family)
MKFIVAGLGNWYSLWNLIREAASAADRLGFYGLAIPDHYIWGREAAAWVGVVEGFDATLESWTALAYLSAETERLKLGTLVTPMSLRPPTILAKVVSTVDIISGGRVFLGVGAGWSKREFEVYSDWSEAAVRVDKTAEAVELVKKLWTMERVDFMGRYYRVRNGILEPKPIQKPHPPLVFGGERLRMLRLAGKYADICYIPPWIKMGFEKALLTVRAAASEAGRGDMIAFAGGSTSPLSSKFDPEAYIRDVEKALGIGCSYYVVSFPRDSYIQSMEAFASTVVPSFT